MGNCKTHNHFSCASQGRYYSGDQAAQRPHVLCSICIHSFGALVEAVQLIIASLVSQLCVLKCALLIFCFFVKIRKGDFLNLTVGEPGVCEKPGISSFDSSSVGSCSLLIDTYSLSLTVFSVI